MMMMGHHNYYNTGNYSNNSGYYGGGYGMRHGMMMYHSSGYRGYSTTTAANTAASAMYGAMYGRHMGSSVTNRPVNTMTTYRTSTPNAAYRGGMRTSGGYRYSSGTGARNSVAARYLAQSRTTS